LSYTKLVGSMEIIVNGSMSWIDKLIGRDEKHSPDDWIDRRRSKSLRRSRSRHFEIVR